jgi:[ribosomal protein S18]-alanine N-acetyltransferase
MVPIPNSNSRASSKIRPATPEDVAAIFALEKSIPSAAHWPESTYCDIFAQEGPKRIALVAKDQRGKSRDAICGFVVARLAGGDCEIENIFVAPPNQHGGLGSQLLQSLAAAARNHNATRIFLEVRESNDAARALYEKCGFALTGRRPNYYTDPVVVALLYTLPL